MTLLCFLLDLRSISPQLLRDLKQCLLQLANLYAVSSDGPALQDLIGLCCIHRKRSVPSPGPASADGDDDEILVVVEEIMQIQVVAAKTGESSCNVFVRTELKLKIVYSPSGNFNLRDFHHAVNNMPTDGFLAEFCESGAPRSATTDAKLTKLLSKEALCSWCSKDILRKVILITSALPQNSDTLRETFMEAAEQYISLEFVVFEHEAIQNNNTSENVKGFLNSISDLENCLLKSYFPDTRLLGGLVKRWLQELKDEVEEPLQVLLLFKNGLVGSVNQILCNLSATATHTIDGFIPCQACRCHGLPVDGAGVYQKNQLICPVTFHELGSSDLIENAMKVGKQTILFLPSFQSCSKCQRVLGPVTFNVTERTNLASLSEGVLMGSSFFVTPATYHDVESTSEGYDKSELNSQLFHGLCRALYSLDQGLVCHANCNTETMHEATFHYYYILQPSDKGTMLLRMLAGSEEILPIPESIESTSSPLPKEVEKSIQDCLSKVELKDYDPFHHERGFHQKINCLVKESLHFGSIPPKKVNKTCQESKPNSSRSQKLSEPSTQAAPIRREVNESNKTTPIQTAAKFDETADCITEEWQQLMVTEVGCNYSPTCISKPNFENMQSPASDGHKPMNKKTTSILERLEAPKQQKTKESPPLSFGNFRRDEFRAMKKPLVPFGPNHAVDQGQGLSLSQPIKPNFQRAKRKHQ